MADPYWRYAGAGPPPSADRDKRSGSIPKPNFPGYLSSDPSTVTTMNPYSSRDFRTTDFLQRDILPSRHEAYGNNDATGIHPNAEASAKGYPSSFEDPDLLGHRRDVASGISPSVPDVNYERPHSGPTVSAGESNILFVDGLPTDCTRREIGHLFRPFIGFRELRVVHKEPRRRGERAMVLCFVEFTDAKCARTAMEALQDYKFDDKKPDAPLLRIHFAHFPFRLPSDRDDKRLGSLR